MRSISFKHKVAFCMPRVQQDDLIVAKRRRQTQGLSLTNGYVHVGSFQGCLYFSAH